MKYVRTENAIEEVLREEGELIFTRHGYIPKDMAIKASDSIEKLCNALVVTGDYDGKEFHKYCPTESDSVDDLKKRYREYGVRIYGAIWTDKGLKYVAKMNGEEELELLWPGN